MFVNFETKLVSTTLQTDWFQVIIMGQRDSIVPLANSLS